MNEIAGPTGPSSEPAAAPSRGPSRVPEILTQALFTLVAVVLAFAVEEWREERELDRVVDEARTAILQEIKHNHDELLESRQDTLDMAARLRAAIDAAKDAESPALRELRVSFELALLSSAAWRSAQTMDVARRMDHDWMLQVARAHELQAMYEQVQWEAVGFKYSMQAATDPAQREAHARALLARLEALAAFSKSVEDDYTAIR